MLLSQSAFTCSKSTMETSEQCVNSVQVYSKDTGTTLMTSPCVFIGNFEQISHIVLVFALLTLKKWMPAE